MHPAHPVSRLVSETKPGYVVILVADAVTVAVLPLSSTQPLGIYVQCDRPIYSARSLLFINFH